MTAKQLDSLTLDKAVKLIKKALINQDRYSKDITTSINKAAGDLLAYVKCLRDLEQLDCCYYYVTTKDGRQEVKLHPVCCTLPMLSRSLGRSLNELGLVLPAIEADEATDKNRLLEELE